MDEYQIKNKIHELKSYIASNWPGIEERKHLYQRVAILEKTLREMKDPPKKQSPEIDRA